MRKVVILKRYDRKFRMPLYNILGEKLKNADIQFEITYGQADKYEEQTIKDIITENKWGIPVKNKYFYIGNRSLCWQPVLRYTKDADLVIIQQGNKLLINYLIQIRRFFKKKPLIAYWGHGMNFQAKHENSLLEKFKALYSNHVDYWFAYNDLTEKILIERNFNEKKIFSLQNTIDTKEEIRLFNSISPDETESIRKDLGISQKDIVGIYCGSIYAHKRIEFLIQSLQIVKKRFASFQFIIVGDGIMRSELLELMSGNESWIHYVGSKFGVEKLKYFKISSFQLIPGLVGLNIIDSFITLCPLITTENNLHSPEISYLINNKNGVITENTLGAYTNSIIKVLSESDLLEVMKKGCEEARKEYTIENMANNFYEGITHILKE